MGNHRTSHSPERVRCRSFHTKYSSFVSGGLFSATASLEFLGQCTKQVLENRPTKITLEERICSKNYLVAAVSSYENRFLLVQ